MSLLRKTVRSNVRTGLEPPCQSCHLGDNKSDMMQEFESECQKVIWHVFHVLDNNQTGTVQVSQLKVITSNVGLNLGIKKAEELLNKENSPPTMDFDTYFKIVKEEVIEKQDTQNEEDLQKILYDRLTHVIKSCWMFCNFERNHKSISFTNEHCSILWRLFNLLCETDDNGSVKIPIMLHSDEAILLIRNFIETTGQLKKEQLLKKLSEEEGEGSLMTFTDLLNIFERDFVGDLNRNAISLGLNHLYDTYVLNILKKGMLWKRGYNVKTWKERWFVLTPTHLKYFVSLKEKDFKGAIEFDMDCKLEVPVDRPTHKPNRFIVVTKKKPYDMSAPDVKTKNEWVSAIEVAMDRVGKSPNIQKEAALERCRARALKKRLAEEEERRRQEEAQKLIDRSHELDEEKRKRMDDEELLRARLEELEAERKRREDAEARFQEEQALRELEQERLRELERIKLELERLLEEERQAKKDEEIVRNLQSRLLEEEFQRREELERLQKQQQEILSAEREHRECLESERREQERLLEQARLRLEQLEREQAAAAAKMQEAASKLERAEKDRRIMEDKARLWRTPVGLARPIQPHAEPLVTHRGYGAFCIKDFVKKPGSQTLIGNNSSGSSMSQELQSSAPTKDGDNGAHSVNGGNEKNEMQPVIIVSRAALSRGSSFKESAKKSDKEHVNEEGKLLQNDEGDGEKQNLASEKADISENQVHSKVAENAMETNSAIPFNDENGEIQERSPGNDIVDKNQDETEEIENDNKSNAVIAANDEDGLIKEASVEVEDNNDQTEIVQNGAKGDNSASAKSSYDKFEKKSDTENGKEEGERLQNDKGGNGEKQKLASGNVDTDENWDHREVNEKAPEANYAISANAGNGGIQDSSPGNDTTDNNQDETKDIKNTNETNSVIATIDQDGIIKDKSTEVEDEDENVQTENRDHREVNEKAPEANSAIFVNAGNGGIQDSSPGNDTTDNNQDETKDIKNTNETNSVIATIDQDGIIKDKSIEVENEDENVQTENRDHREVNEKAPESKSAISANSGNGGIQDSSPGNATTDNNQDETKDIKNTNETNSVIATIDEDGIIKDQSIEVEDENVQIEVVQNRAEGDNSIDANKDVETSEQTSGNVDADDQTAIVTETMKLDSTMNANGDDVPELTQSTKYIGVDENQNKSEADKTVIALGFLLDTNDDTNENDVARMDFSDEDEDELQTKEHIVDDTVNESPADEEMVVEVVGENGAERNDTLTDGTDECEKDQINGTILQEEESDVSSDGEQKTPDEYIRKHDSREEMYDIANGRVTSDVDIVDETNGIDIECDV